MIPIHAGGITAGMHKLIAVLLVSGGVASAESKLVGTNITFGTPKITGTYAASAVQRVMTKGKPQLTACYRKSLATDAGLKATGTAMFAIEATGKVSSVAVVGMTDAALETCVTGVIAKLKFDRPKAKIEVEAALTFDPTPPPTRGGAFGSIIGTTTGDNDVYGGLLGSEAGEMNGGFGYGRTGFGPGGGGTGWGTIGTGRYGTIGHGTATLSLVIGQPTVTGDLDKAIIRRYIKRNFQKLSYCAEKEAAVKPLADGTITASFTIALDGTVSSSTASGFSNKAVETCMADVIGGIEFPKPKGTSVVSVTYPIQYRAPKAAAPKKK